MPPDYVLKARDRFASWLLWFIASYPEVAPTQAALARRLGLTKPAIHRLLVPGSQRIPSLETVLAAEKLIGFPINVLLHSDPPVRPGHR